MKKLLLSIMAMFAVVVSNAWTVNFTNPDGWSTVYIWAWTQGGEGKDMMGTDWPGQTMTQSGDVWTYSQSDDNGTPDYIIFNNNSSQTGQLDFQNNATYTKTGIVGAETYQHTVYFKNTDNWSNVYVFCWDGYNTDAYPGLQLSVNSEGLYPWTVETNSQTVPSNVKFQFNNGMGGDDERKTGDIETYTEGAIYDASGEIVSGDVEGGNAPENLYILGNIKDCDWNPANTPKFSKNGSIFTISDIELANASSYFCFTNILTEDWSVINDETHRYCSANGGSFNTEGPNSFQLVGDVSWQLPAGTYSFEVNFDTMTAKITSSEEAPAPDLSDAVLYVRGEFNDWGTTAQMEKNNGVYSYVLENYDGGGFKIADDNWGYFNYGLADDNGMEEGTIKLTEGSSSKNIWIKNWTEGETLYLSFNLKTLELTANNDPATGVKAFETVNGEDVIYNLQGVRVSNPTKGIYIINGKKVIVK